MRKIFKMIALLALAAIIAHNAYAQGVRHAITTACPYVDRQVILIDYEGEVHEYDMV